MIVIQYDVSLSLLEVDTEEATLALRISEVERVRLDKEAEHQSGCIVYVSMSRRNLKFEFDTKDEAARFYSDIFLALQ